MITHIPIVGDFKYRDADTSSPAGGILYFEDISPAIVDDGVVTLPILITATIGADGHVPTGFTLPTVTGGVFYRVVESFIGAHQPYVIQVLPTDNEIDLATVVPSVPEIPLLAYLTSAAIGSSVAGQGALAALAARVAVVEQSPGGGGAVGPQGPVGPAGADGADGTNGAQGIQGIPGIKGDPGAAGAAGTNGLPGADGAKGDTGTAGATGGIGPAGPAGQPPAWSVATTTVGQNQLEHEAVIAAIGVVDTDTLELMLAPSTDADENTPDMLDLLVMSAISGTDQFTINMAFTQPTSGPIGLLYRN